MKRRAGPVSVDEQYLVRMDKICICLEDILEALNGIKDTLILMRYKRREEVNPDDHRE